MANIKIKLTVFILIVLSKTVSATVWPTAYPYTQQIEGQNVVIKAQAYDPYSGSPAIGVTKVYLNKKLLYTIDKYYRENIFTSNDGQYLAVVNTSIEYFWGTEKINFDETAIEVFKNGQTFKTYALKDIFDTTKFTNSGPYCNWGYSLDFKAFENAIWNCKKWQKTFNRRDKRECLNGDTSLYCREWIQGCDSMKIFKLENFIFKNSIYVQNNSLFVLTNQDVVLKLDFATLTVQQLPYDNIVPNKNTFNPPKLKRKYKKLKLPNKFAQPNLIDGRSLKEGVAELFNLSIPTNGEKGTFVVFIYDLVIDRKGKCTNFHVNAYDKRISKYFEKESINQEMTEKLNNWIKEQTFQTKLIPKNFDYYSFLCIVELK